jgi:hypothetical protein
MDERTESFMLDVLTDIKTTKPITAMIMIAQQPPIALPLGRDGGGVTGLEKSGAVLMEMMVGAELLVRSMT